MTFRYLYWLWAGSLALFLAVFTFSALALADEPTESDASASETVETKTSATDSNSSDLTEEQIARAKELLEGWDRPAPKLELTEKWRVTLPVDEFVAASWAQESDHIALLTLQQEVLVLDATDGRELARFKGKAEDRPDIERTSEGAPKGAGLPQAIAITPNGKRVAIACPKGVVLWGWAEDKVESVHASDGIKEMHFSDNGNWIFYVSDQRKIYVYQLFTGKGRFWTHSLAAGIYPVELAIDPQGQCLLYREGRARRFFEMQLENGEVRKKPFVIGQKDTLCVAAGKTIRVMGGGDGDLLIYETPTNDSAIHWKSVATPLSVMRHVYVSRDERYVMGTNGVRDLVVHEVDSNLTKWQGLIPEGRLRAVQSDLSAVLAANTKGELVRYDVAPLGKHPAREMELHIRDILERKAFDELDALFEAASGSDSFPFSPMNTKFGRLAAELNFSPIRAEPRGRINPIIKEWRETHAHRPGAAYRIAADKVETAWNARGSGFAITVTPKGAEDFRKEFLAAHEVLDPIFNRDRAPPMELFQVWFQVGMGVGWPPNVIRANIARYLERIDRYETTMDVIGVMLLPRWYGENTDAHEFAKRVRETLPGRDGRIAYARIAAHLFRFHGSDVWGTLEFNSEDIREGLLLALQQSDCPSEFLDVTQGIARIFNDDELLSAVFRRREKNARGEP
jgi:hypothetical protein